MWKRSRILRARGVALVYAIVAMTVVCGMISFAVDWGHVQLARTELQRAADSAARYAVTGLTDNTYATKAITAAGDNSCDGSNIVITASDALQGNWDDTKTPQFDSTRGPINAVQVIITKSIPLPFAKVFGFSGKTVTVTSVAISSNQYSFVGLNSVNVSGQGNVDSYDSSLGDYSSGSARSNGDVISNGSIQVGGSGIIKGDGHPGIGKSVYFSGSGTITGSTTPLKSTLSYSLATLPASYQSVGPINLTSGTFTGGASGVTTNYYCTSVAISHSAWISCIGPVKIYCSGPVNISGGYVKTYLNRPMNFQILMLNSSSITLGGQADLYAQVYAPQSDFTQSGKADIFGSIIAKTLTFGGSWQGGVHLDESIATPGTYKAILMVK